MKDSESVQEHVKTMLETFNELSIVGNAITDEDRVVYPLASLPESFNTLIIALEANPTVPEMEVVIERLIHEEKKLKYRGLSSEPGSDGALAVRHKTRLRRSKCYGCQRFVHIQRNCPECARSLAEPRPSDYSRQTGKKGKKGVKNEVHQTRVE